MGCNSDYLNPTLEEENKVKISRLICFVNDKLGYKNSNSIFKASKSTYGEGVNLNEIVIELCNKLTSLNKKQKEEIIYNSKSKNSRELADWWEEHQEADKARIKEEEEEKKRKKLVASALKKLTPSEIKALKIK